MVPMQGVNGLELFVELVLTMVQPLDRSSDRRQLDDPRLESSVQVEVISAQSFQVDRRPVRLVKEDLDVSFGLVQSRFGLVVPGLAVANLVESEFGSKSDFFETFCLVVESKCGGGDRRLGPFEANVGGVQAAVGHVQAVGQVVQNLDEASDERAEDSPEGAPG